MCAVFELCRGKNMITQKTKQSIHTIIITQLIITMYFGILIFLNISVSSSEDPNIFFLISEKEGGIGDTDTSRTQREKT